jgi:hypothetical protein
MWEISRILIVGTSAPSEIPRATWREQLISHISPAKAWGDMGASFSLKNQRIQGSVTFVKFLSINLFGGSHSAAEF